MCLAGKETIDHLLLKCRSAQRLWRVILGWFNYCGSLLYSIPSLFEYWRLGVGSKRTFWKLSFLEAIWTIWKERNLRCFIGKPTDEINLMEKLKHLVALWASPLPHFMGFSVDSIILNWKEVAFVICQRHLFVILEL